MTAPKVHTIKRGDSRFYVHPETDAKAPGVTSVVGMLPKPFLTRWAAKEAATFAVENLGPVVQFATEGNKPAAVDLIKGAPWRDSGQAAATGTEVHELFEALAKGEAVNTRRLTPEMKAYAGHFNEFRTEFEPEFLFNEETVWSEEHDYAGSFDTLVRINDENVLLDYKTTRSGVYPEVALQLAAYAHADGIIRPDGTKVDLPKIDAGAVLHARPEGWSLVPVRIDEEVFNYFLHLRKTFDWNRDVSMTVLGKSLNTNPTVSKRGQNRANF